MSERIPHLTRCRVCRCTEIAPCCPPCGWARGEEDLCTTCQAVTQHVAAWLQESLRPSWAALRREAERVLKGGE